jgi:hypothetical protein
MFPEELLDVPANDIVVYEAEQSDGRSGGKNF